MRKSKEGGVAMIRRGTIYCSFCGKPECDVCKLIVGPNWQFICDECVLHSVRIVTEKYPAYRMKVVAELDAASQQEIKDAVHAAVNRIEGDQS